MAHLPWGGGPKTLFEAASGLGLAAAAKELGVGTCAADLFRLAAEGHLQAGQLVRDAVAAMGLLLAWLQQSVDPEIICWGGGVVEAQHPELLKRVCETSRALTSRICAARPVAVLPAELGADGGIIGAAVLCMGRNEPVAGGHTASP